MRRARKTMGFVLFDESTRRFDLLCSRKMACSRNRELDNFVNTNSFSVVELEKALTTKLREVLASVPWLDAVISRFPTISEKGFDLLVKVKPPTGKAMELWVQFKADPRPSQFPYVVSGRKRLFFKNALENKLKYIIYTYR